MTNYRIFDADLLRDWLTRQPALHARLGGAPTDWTIREVSDGNLNTVFLVHGPGGSLCAKQSLPHVRVAPDWPMPLERALYEARYMRTVAPAVVGLAPRFLAYDDTLFLIIMECLTGYTVLRTALMDDSVQAGFSASIGRYVAQTALATGWATQPFETGAALLEHFSGNTALTRITVDLILTDPYRPCDRNPEPEAGLEDYVRQFQTDATLLKAVTRLKLRFLSVRQALLHGDLHTGSIMVQGTETRVIDGEFATMGPLGFDCGLYLGNLALYLCAAPHRTSLIEAEIRDFWDTVSKGLLAGLNEDGGDVSTLCGSNERQFMAEEFQLEILRDTAGFCGAELIRRTIGFAQVADYDLCETPESRLCARQKALETGKALILGGPSVHSLSDVLALLRLPAS